MRALIIALVVVGSLLSASSAGSASTPAVVFSVLPHGWRTADGYALSWAYRPDRGGWAASMPRNGIAVWVIVLGSPRTRYPPLRLSLPTKPFATLEGAPDTPEYRITGRVHGHDVEIRVDIRRLRPTARQLRMPARRLRHPVRFSPVAAFRQAVPRQ